MEDRQRITNDFVRSLMTVMLICVGLGINEAAAQTTTSIDCNAGETLSGALRAAEPGDTIQIIGTCSERVTVMTDRLTLDGMGGAIIDGGGANGSTQGVVTIRGAQGVVLTNLTVQNGPDGIVGQQGAAFTVRDIVIQDNANEGLQIDENSTARVENLTVQRNGAIGLYVLRMSNVTFSGTIISRDNGSTGYAILQNSNVAVFSTLTEGSNGVMLQSNGNGASGFVVSRNSSANLSGTRLDLDNNGLNGLSVVRNSTVAISDSEINLTSNMNRGLVVTSSSVFTISTSNLNVSNNSSNGITVANSSFFSTSQVLIANNGNYGLDASMTSDVVLFNQAQLPDGSVTLQNNRTGNLLLRGNSRLLASRVVFIMNDIVDVGVRVNNSSLTIDEPSFSGHSTDISLRFGSRLSFFNLPLFNLNISCDQTVLVEFGGLTCPTADVLTSAQKSHLLEVPRVEIQKDLVED